MTDKPRIGQIRVASLWFNGDEQRRKAEGLIEAVFRDDERNFGLVLGPIWWEVLDANDGRLQDAKPPEDGAQVIVGYREILGFMPMPAEDAGFIANLDPADLDKLRRATWRAYKKANPGAAPIPQDQIDRIIGRLGPEVAGRLVSQ